jgi:CDP-glucose 4,6-dehydratase
MFDGAFANRTVWLSGHTGFKGAWLAQWLLGLGAKVRGFALPPPTRPSLFEQLGLAARLHHHEIADLRDAAAVQKSILLAQPDFVFHLAAQPLVRLSYQQPLETLATNVLGTAHVLEALRPLDKPCVAVLITSDKCYENRERPHAFREEDPLGGHDPYSASKAAAEIVIAAFRRSFFSNHPVKIASARAGNVIGGGDWALDRIVPDCIRALSDGESIAVRNPQATRPWQHVLEPLSGYLWLAARLAAPSAADPALCSAFNFGPGPDAHRTVSELVAEILKHWPGTWENRNSPDAVHEAGRLQLAIDKAQAHLGWRPVWSFAEAVAHTAVWYRQIAETEPSATSRAALELSADQIQQYTRQARQQGLPWATE